MTPDLLIYLLVIAAVIVMNYLTQRAAKRARRDRARHDEPLQGVPAGGGAEHEWGRHPPSTVPPPPKEVGEYEWGLRPASSVPPPPEEVGEYEWGGRSRQPSQVAAAEKTEYDAVPGRELPVQARGATRDLASSEAARKPRRTPEGHTKAARLFARPEDLRRAVIAMTVLGPCRAIEQPDAYEAARPTRGH